MKHLTLADFSDDNISSYVEKPDPNFSRERNFAVIERVIRESDQMQRKMDSTVEKNAGNVADILASFAKYKLDIGGEKQLEQWLGKSWMSRIYGEKLIEKIRMAEAIQQENLKKGNTLYNGMFYTK